MKTQGIRITGTNKNFYVGHLNAMTDHIVKNSGGLIIDAQFGKQDMRGCFSITLIDNRHCVSSQKFFATKHEMLGYVVGYNEAKKIHGFDEIALYNIKEVA